MKIPATMRAVRKLMPGAGLQLVSVPVPTPGPRDVLIRVRAAGICGTDYHIYTWDAWSQQRIKPALTIGHEFVGEIVVCGSEVHTLEPGMRVSAEGHVTCGICKFCRTGRGHICRAVKGLGVDCDGCFAEYVVVPEHNVWRVPSEVPDRHAAVYDPLGNAMHTAMAASLSLRTVLIMGAGAIGLFAVAIVKVAGAALVIVVEPNQYKRTLAAEVGADVVLDPASDDVLARVSDLTDGYGPDVILEMSGNPKAMQQAFRLLGNGGEICLLGIPAGGVQVDWAEDIMFKGITIHGITGRRMFETWYYVDEFLLRHGARIDPCITHVLPFEQIEEGFALMRAGTCGKIVLEFPI
ncbi:MAG: L-threonine 3-dehydrogenase [bacterium]|nr:L-threonine 3-dehydrogenase [bacterium]